jgi:hypothetical protein
VNYLATFLAGVIITALIGYLTVPGLKSDPTHDFNRRFDSLQLASDRRLDSLIAVNDSLAIHSKQADTIVAMQSRRIENLKTRTNANVQNVYLNDDADSLVNAIKRTIQRTGTARDTSGAD